MLPEAGVACQPAVLPGVRGARVRWTSTQLPMRPPTLRSRLRRQLCGGSCAGLHAGALHPGSDGAGKCSWRSHGGGPGCWPQCGERGAGEKTRSGLRVLAAVWSRVCQSCQSGLTCLFLRGCKSATAGHRCMSSHLKSRMRSRCFPCAPQVLSLLQSAVPSCTDGRHQDAVRVLNCSLSSIDDV